MAGALDAPHARQLQVYRRMLPEVLMVVFRSDGRKVRHASVDADVGIGAAHGIGLSPVQPVHVVRARGKETVLAQRERDPLLQIELLQPMVERYGARMVGA